MHVHKQEHGVRKISHAPLDVANLLTMVVVLHLSAIFVFSHPFDIL